MGNLFRGVSKLRKKDPLSFYGFLINFLMSSVALLGVLTTLAINRTTATLEGIIKSEADYAYHRNAMEAASLYTTNAEIFDAAPGGTNWIGKANITVRYAVFLPSFKRLVHMDVRIDPIYFWEKSAAAESLSQGETVGQPVTILGKDVWEFERVDAIAFLPWTGEWKIKKLTVNLPINK